MHLKNNFETMIMQDKLIAVPIGENVEFNGALKLNRTAAIIFELLREETTEPAIVDAIAQQFDIPQEKISADVHDYLELFRKKNLLVE